jgi:hypothetical protein
VTITTWSFVIRDIDTAGLAGIGVIAWHFRYCAIQWLGIDRLDRRLPRDWKSVKAQIEQGFSPAPLPHHSTIHSTLAGDLGRSVTVQYLSSQALTVENRTEVAGALDQLAKGQMQEYRSGR